MDFVYKYKKINNSEVENMGVRYPILYESRWSLICKKTRVAAIIFSKVYQDNFDWSIFENLHPADLEPAEKHEAAMAIYGQHLNSKIPESWRKLSLELCGPSTKKAIFHLSSEISAGIYCPLFRFDQPVAILLRWLVASGDIVKFNQEICVIMLENEEYTICSLDLGKIQIFVDKGSFIDAKDLIGEIL